MSEGILGNFVAGRGVPIVFGPFRLDTVDERLWRGDAPVFLSPKAFALLRYLAERPGRLQRKEDILHALWPGTLVTDASLHGCIREIRRALGDESRVPRFVETVHRRGYRFIAQTATGRPAAGTGPDVPDGPPTELKTTSPLIGREAQLDQLGAAFRRAAGGVRQVVFVTGEAGIGKTTLVDTFLQVLTASVEARLARGQCVEYYGPSEAYLPVFEAFGQLAGGPGGPQVREILARYAPTWLAQMPALASGPSPPPGPGMTHERMLREMAEAIEALAAETPLVLVLEDVHWVDYSTLDLVSALAQRRGPARLLLLLTFRPSDALARRHPLRGVKLQLQVHGQCRELALEPLCEAHVGRYLCERFTGLGASAGLATMIHRRTDGNPLFLVNVVDYLIACGRLVEHSGRWELTGPLDGAELEVPEGIREMVERQADQVSADERRVLEAAAVAGVEFSAGAVAATLRADPAAIEERCDGLSDRQLFLRRCAAPGPGREATPARYRFLHGLYREVLYARIPPSRRVSWHLQVAHWEETTDAGRTWEAAAELAMHFERGRDYPRAVRHLERAAERSARVLGHREAIGHLRSALELLGKLAATQTDPGQELRLQMALGLELQISEGYASPGADRAYARARELCGRMPEAPGLATVLWGMWMFAAVRADNRTALDVAERLHGLGGQVQDQATLLNAQASLGITRLFLGDLADARRHLEQAIALHDPGEHGDLALSYGQDPRATCLAHLANALWLLGFPNQAAQMSRQAVSLAEELGHAHSLALALYFSAVLHQRLRDPDATRLRADALGALAAEHGFALWSAGAVFLRGWAATNQGDLAAGIETMQRGLTDWRSTGAAVNQTFYLVLLAEALGAARRIDEGLAALAEAEDLMRQTDERYYEAELHRVRGELRRTQAAPEGETRRRGRRPRSSAHGQPRTCKAAEASFREAISVATRQGARALELRATIGSLRLDRECGAGDESSKTLRTIYRQFDEGFDTRDLCEARTLLEALDGG